MERRSATSSSTHSVPSEAIELLNQTTGNSSTPYSPSFFDPLAGWLTLVAAGVIFYIALYPFNFSPGVTALRRQGPFFDWFVLVAKSWDGWLENVLFFMPFGLGWAWWSRVKGRRIGGSWWATGLLGLLFSFGIEFLQLYVPTRDSSWDDVVMNTLGALAGWALFRYCGAPCLRFMESALEELTASIER
jgi:glycopeptide antibiotics resistance protein